MKSHEESLYPYERPIQAERKSPSVLLKIIKHAIIAAIFLASILYPIRTYIASNAELSSFLDWSGLLTISVSLYGVASSVAKTSDSISMDNRNKVVTQSKGGKMSNNFYQTFPSQPGGSKRNARQRLQNTHSFVFLWILIYGLSLIVWARFV